MTRTERHAQNRTLTLAQGRLPWPPETMRNMQRRAWNGLQLGGSSCNGLLLAELVGFNPTDVMKVRPVETD